MTSAKKVTLLDKSDNTPIAPQTVASQVMVNNGTLDAKLEDIESKIATGSPEVLVNQLADGQYPISQAMTTSFNADGSITQTWADGKVLNTTFNSDGSITETLVGEWSKTTTFNEDGSIGESITKEEVV